MDSGTGNEITRILHDWSAGDETARDELLPLVYTELKRHARVLMSHERNGHTLQPTALVHEALLKLGFDPEIAWQDRRHFFGILSHLMRQILVDHARKHASAKRGGGFTALELDDQKMPFEERASSLLNLNEALCRLEKIDENQAKIVEMRFFGGMTNDEIAALLNISERTVVRDWQTARLWLSRELKNHGGGY